MLTISLTIPSSSVESIPSDYDLLCSMFQDEIIEIDKSSPILCFIIKQNYEIDISKATAQLLSNLSFDELILNNEQMYLPYWIKFNYDSNTHIIVLNFYIYWIKYNKSIMDSLNKSITQTEEPYLYNIIENVKSTLQNSIDKDLLINIIQEISESTIIDVDQSPINYLFQVTGANKGQDDYHYNIKKNNKEIKASSLITPKDKNELIKSLSEPEQMNNDIGNDESNYEKFFACGGMIGDSIQDRKSVFVAHAIKVKSKGEVNQYRSYLVRQRKIKKATHNIIAYRIFDDKSNEIIEDYNDDGENEAGIKLLGIIQKMKIINVFVMVTRWFGGILLYQDRFKHINDAAKLLFNDNKGKFDIEN